MKKSIVISTISISMFILVLLFGLLIYFSNAAEIVTTTSALSEVYNSESVEIDLEWLSGDGWFEATVRNSWGIPIYNGIQFFCSQPGAQLHYSGSIHYEDALAAVDGSPYEGTTDSKSEHADRPEEGEITYPVYRPTTSGTLTPAAAYIASVDLDNQEYMEEYEEEFNKALEEILPIEEEIEELQGEISNLNTKKDNYQKLVEMYRERVERYEELLEEALEKGAADYYIESYTFWIEYNTKYLDRYQENVDEVQAEIDELQAEIDELQAKVDELIDQIASLQGISFDSWEEQQKALWNLRAAGLDGGLITGGGVSEHDGSSIYDQEAIEYAQYHSTVAENGLEVEDLTSLSDEETLYNRSTGKYTIGPFKIKYNSGTTGSVTYAGISNMVIYGYNYNYELVRTDIQIESFLLKDTATGVWGNAVTPEYFEPDGNYVDRTTQVYPASEQEFMVVFTDPNKNVSDYSQKVKYIEIKIEFKYMLAEGVYQKFVGVRYEVNYKCSSSHISHDSDESCPGYEHTETAYLTEISQQEIMMLSAERSLHTEELTITYWISTDSDSSGRK